MLSWYRKYPTIWWKLIIAFSFMAFLTCICLATVIIQYFYLTDQLANVANPAFKAAVDQTLVWSLGTYLACSVVGLTGAYLFSRGIAVPYSITIKRMQALADGDLDSPIQFTDYKDCVGRLTRAMHIFRDAAVARIQAEQDVRRVQAEQQTIVDALEKSIHEMANGNLSTGITTRFPDNYERLRQNFNLMQEALRSALSDVASTAEIMRTGSAEIATASDDLASRTERQASSLQETSNAMADVSQSVSDTARRAAEASKSVSETERDASNGGEVVRRAVAAMGQIEQSSQEIAQIIGVIDSIAFQTNLLALNAGVEAARAGEAGRGFAVVANEVRALAQRSADAAKTIKDLITQSANQVSSGVSLVNETGDALTRIVERITSVSSLIQEIAETAETQSASAGQVNTAVAEMDRTTQQNAAMVEQSTAAARNLASEAAELANLVERFQLVPATGHNIAMAA